jgi:hypothetical protein
MNMFDENNQYRFNWDTPELTFNPPAIPAPTMPSGLDTYDANMKAYMDQLKANMSKAQELRMKQQAEQTAKMQELMQQKQSDIGRTFVNPALRGLQAYTENKAARYGVRPTTGGIEGTISDITQSGARADAERLRQQQMQLQALQGRHAAEQAEFADQNKLAELGMGQAGTRTGFGLQQQQIDATALKSRIDAENQRIANAQRDRHLSILEEHYRDKSTPEEKELRNTTTRVNLGRAKAAEEAQNAPVVPPVEAAAAEHGRNALTAATQTATAAAQLSPELVQLRDYAMTKAKQPGLFGQSFSEADRTNMKAAGMAVAARIAALPTIGNLDKSTVIKVLESGDPQQVAIMMDRVIGELNAQQQAVAAYKAQPGANPALFPSVLGQTAAGKVGLTAKDPGVLHRFFPKFFGHDSFEGATPTQPYGTAEQAAVNATRDEERRKQAEALVFSGGS